MQERGRSPAQLYCLVFGVVLVAAGILGFFYEASFDVGDSVKGDEVLGILLVNGWHNIVHIAAGVAALAFAGSYSGARQFALVYAIVYVLIAIVGFAYGNDEFIIDVIPINTEDNVLHVLIALAGFGAYAATPAAPAPTTARTT